MKRLNAFISYSNIDKKNAGYIKEYLERYCGFNAFLAHSDINVSNNWRIKILESLNGCDIFIPLLSSSSKHSFFVNQEIGFACALNRVIIPIKIDVNPFGFIELLQALPCHSFTFTNLIQLTSNISAVLVRDPSLLALKSPAFESLLIALKTSESFRDTRIIMHMILESISHIDVTDEYRDFIKNCIETNAQISGELFLLKNFKKSLKLI